MTLSRRRPSCAEWSSHLWLSRLWLQPICVFKNLSSLGSLHRVCPATGGSALRNSGPIRCLGCDQLAEALRCGPIFYQGLRSGDGLRPAHSVLKQMKTKANEAVSRPSQLPRCVQRWKTLQSSVKENRIYHRYSNKCVFVCQTQKERGIMKWMKYSSMTHKKNKVQICL